MNIDTLHLPRVRLDGANRTRYFRRVFRIDQTPATANITLFVDGVYHLWVNGLYVSRGPAHHHPDTRPFDAIELTPYLRSEHNCVAILTHSPGISLHNYVPTTEPHIVGQLDLTHGDSATAIPIDASWRTLERTGFGDDVPRRGWAIGHIEHFDAAIAPTGWRERDFDDSDWSPATVYSAPIKGVTDVDRPVPALRFGRASVSLISVYACDAAPLAIAASTPSHVLGKALVDLPRFDLDAGVTVRNLGDRRGNYAVDGLSKERGVVLICALEEQVTGQVIFNCESDTPGTIDIGWSETMVGDQPQIVRKGTGYCDRVLARAGLTDWQPIGYSSMRYLQLVLRGFSGRVKIRDLCVRTSEPAVAWRSTFETDDPMDARIWRMCVRSQAAGAQESLTDCPTREQAAYVGDGVLIGRWVAMLTADTRHWANIINTQFARPFDSGLLPASIFSGGPSSLIDYSLLGLIGLRDYWKYTRDEAIVRKWIGACREILHAFDRLPQRDGLFDHAPEKEVENRAWETAFDTANPRKRIAPSQKLFIDHPGMGWHNVNEPGIDRNGLSAAFNALIVRAWRAMAEMLEAIHLPDENWNDRADELIKRVRATFYDPSQGVYVDAVLDDKRSTQISQQTNAWAIGAGGASDEESRSILNKLSDHPEPEICWGGPYFWAYIFPELTRLGMHDLALRQARSLWQKMLDGGATLLWETFLGDGLDSWCHPWSGAPIEFYLTGIAGLPGLDFDPASVVLKPRTDLLKTCRASIQTRAGAFSIQWERQGDQLHLQGHCPADIQAKLIFPDGIEVSDLRGDWRFAKSPARG